jgi:phage gp46-like protein
MTTDIKLVQDSIAGHFDFAIAQNGDLASVDDFSTALLMSLLTDRRARPEQVVLPQHRRGWIGDTVSPFDNFELGSHLWLLEPAKLLPQTGNIAASYANAALEWLVSNGHALAVRVTPVLELPFKLGLNVEITAPSGIAENHYVALWERTVFVPTSSPFRVDPIPPAEFLPDVPADMFAWVDFHEGTNVRDENLGLEVSTDVSNTVNFVQPDPAKRPLYLIGGPGNVRFARFDGVNQHLFAISNNFPSFQQGTLLLIHKPRVEVDNQRVLCLGISGSNDNIFGLSFQQQPSVADDVMRMKGNGGTLQVDLQGPDDTALYGSVFRWGPNDQGGDGETTSGETVSDDDYDLNIATPNIIVIGAGFDGVVPDESSAAAFDMLTLVLYTRRLADIEVFNLLEYAETRLFVPPEGEPFSDGSFFADGLRNVAGWDD